MDASIDQIVCTPSRSRGRLFALGLSLLLVSFLVGAASLADVSANCYDLVKIVAVVAFIVAMLGLAVGMVGDAYRT